MTDNELAVNFVRARGLLRTLVAWVNALSPDRVSTYQACPLCKHARDNCASYCRGPSVRQFLAETE
jgi:hypothetical protein